MRVDPHFFGELDRQLGEACGPNGEPSTADFLIAELPTIVEMFAESLDGLPPLYPVEVETDWDMS